MRRRILSLKVGLAQMLRGGTIVEIRTVDQAKIAEEAGACSVVVCDPTGEGDLQMPDTDIIKEIKRAVSMPVIVRARVGHFVEAQILEAIGVDYIDESEVLSPADEENFINKHNFRSPFVCGSQGLGEALRRVREGAATIKTQGDLLGSGNIAETVRNVRSVMADIRILNNMDEDEVFAFSKKITAPNDLVAQTKQMGRLPVVNFAAGGNVTPADAALMMQLGCDWGALTWRLQWRISISTMTGLNNLLEKTTSKISPFFSPFDSVSSFCAFSDELSTSKRVLSSSPLIAEVPSSTKLIH